jgi:hypothetical protein
LVGSYHMENPGLDAYNFAIDDPLSLRRQSEIARVVQGLVDFRPTAIALEMEPEHKAAWNEKYRAWRVGQFRLTTDERCQLGFQVAAAVGAESLSAIDWNGESGYGPRPRPGQILEWIRSHQEETYARIAHLLPDLDAFAEAQARSTVGQLLRSLNEPETLDNGLRLYVDIATALNGDDFVGAEWVAGYYRRNLFIFARLRQLAQPGSRILVIYGAGHIPFLRQFAEASGRFVLEDPLAYLPA